MAWSRECSPLPLRESPAAVSSAEERGELGRGLAEAKTRKAAGDLSGQFPALVGTVAGWLV